MSAEVRKHDDLPKEVVMDLLLRLPVKSLMRFMCVSKTWCGLITDSYLVKKHPAHPDMNGDFHDDGYVLLCYDSHDYVVQCQLRCRRTFEERMNLGLPFKSVNGYLRIVGSCNGLICLFDSAYFPVVGKTILWNPIVRKSKVVQDSHTTFSLSRNFSHTVIGFGFVSATNEYKIVEIRFDLDREASHDALIYSLSSDRWKKIGVAAPCYITNKWSNNVFVCGAVHWLAHAPEKSNATGSYNSIMSFDMGSEVFREIELPIYNPLSYDQIHLSTSAQGESLSLFIRNVAGVNMCWDVWMMMEYGVKESWVNMFSIRQAEISLPLGFMNPGKFLLVKENGKLFSFDPEVQDAKSLQISGSWSSFRAIPYVTSIVLIDEGSRRVFLR